MSSKVQICPGMYKGLYPEMLRQRQVQVRPDRVMLRSYLCVLEPLNDHKCKSI